MMIALTDNTSKHRIIVQALQNNFIDCFSFRGKKEIGSSTALLNNQQNKAPRASLQYTYNIHTRQTNLQGPQLLIIWRRLVI